MAYSFTVFKSRIKEIEEWLGREFGGLRTGRATPTLLDGVQVESYGARVPLRQVGSIGVEDPRTLRVTLWDRSQTKAVETALAAANLGVSVSADATALRIIFPELTSEKRQILMKLARDKVEEARISLRQERERVWNEIQAEEKAGTLSEDEKFRLKDELQKIMDEANERLASAGERKQGEISQ